MTKKVRGKPFVVGYDLRRKVLSREECQKGYANALQRIKVRIRSLYRYRKGAFKKGPGGFLPPEVA